MQKKILLFLIGALFILASCAQKAQPIANSEQQKDALSDEIIKLLGLADKGTITEQDFAALESQVLDDEKALDEIHEIKTLVKYKEYMHAVHGISFLAEYLHTKKELLCPGHALAHYYVYRKHGEDELAQEALEEAKAQFSTWKQKIMENQQGHSMEEVIQSITAIDEHLKMINTGKDDATEAEVGYLSEDASICIDGE